jgi:hypothetical protein
MVERVAEAEDRLGLGGELVLVIAARVLFRQGVDRASGERRDGDAGDDRSGTSANRCEAARWVGHGGPPDPGAIRLGSPARDANWGVRDRWRHHPAFG